MKPFLLTLAASTLVGHTALAAANVTALAANVDPNCIPGMTAAVPGLCSLPGHHWQLTTHYLGHGEAQTNWMLLPDR